MSEFPFRGFLCLDGWAGRTETPVLVVGETLKRYLIEAIDRMRLDGRMQWLGAGERALVLKTVIRRNPPMPAAREQILFKGWRKAPWINIADER